jgi:APA family basic amino acid/polyamine antiporter
MTSEQQIQGTEQERKSLTTFDATMLVIGSMIGSGIFIVSADIARSIGSPLMLMLVWLATGVMTLIVALSYGELAGMMPKAGGQYIYLREAYNPMVGFLYGWTFFLVIQTGTIAAVGVAFAKFTGVLLPWWSEKNILVQIGTFKLTAAQILAVASIWLLSYINARGVQEGKIVQNVLTSTKTVALFCIIVIGLVFGANTNAINANFSVLWSIQSISSDGLVLTPLQGGALVLAFASAMVGSLFSSDAWNNVTFTAGEMKDPKRSIPLSLAIGTMTVTGLYMLANVAYLCVLPLQGQSAGADVFARGMQFAVSDRVGTAFVSVVMGAKAEIVMAVFIMISTFGCNNGLILSGARVYRAMALDGLFFQKLTTLNSAGVPANALRIQAVWASLLCLSGTYGDLLDYVIFAVLLFYILTIIGIFRLRKVRPDAERPYKAIGYPVLPALYVIMATVVCIALLMTKPANTYPGLLLVLSGVPVYFFWARTARTTTNTP